MSDARPRFEGSWFTSFGKLCMHDEPGGAVRGTYTHAEGRLHGASEGGVLRGTWVQPGNSREGAFEFTPDASGNTFRGAWRYSGDSEWKGEWNGVRLDLDPEEQGGSPAGWNSHAEGPLLAGPMLGEVGEGEARVWVQARDASPITLRVLGPEGEAKRCVASPEWSEWLCAVLAVDGLRPGVAYEYEIESRHGRTPRYPLRLAPPRGARRALIAFGSCYWDFPNSGLRIFDAIGREGCDTFIMLGDTSYCAEPDWQTEHTMMLTHLRHRNNDRLRRLLAATPTLGMWDDHDLGPNDSDGHFAGREMASRAFKRCWAQASWGLPEAPGLFSTVRAGPAEIFLLDSRTFRRLEGRNILGAAQLRWLFDALSASDAPVKIIASPTQVLPEIPVRKDWDSFRRDAPGELEQLLGEIEARELRGVVLISGDVHMANLMHLPGRALGGRREPRTRTPDHLRGPDFWELTSSPLANAPWNDAANGEDPYILREVVDQVNYGLVDIDLDRWGREIILALKGEDGETFFEQPIALSALSVR